MVNGANHPVTLSVLIIEDNELVREGLKQVVSMAAGTSRAVALPSFDAGVTTAKNDRFDLLIVDIGLATGGPKEAVRALKSSSPGSRIVLLASDIAKQDLLESLAVGAHGFLLKSAPLADLASGIRDVVSGRIHVPAEIHLPLPDAATLPSGIPDYERLSPRQMQVARELALGARTKQIARKLNLSEGTVKLHLSAIFRALGCNSRAEAVAILSRHPPTD